MTFSEDKQINCYQIQNLMDLYISNINNLTIEKRKIFEAHLCKCPKCSKEYEEGKQAISLITKYWSYEAENQAFLKRLDNPAQCEKLIKENWDILKREITGITQFENHKTRLLLLCRIGKVAACLAIGISILLAFLIYSKPKISPKPAPQQVALAPKPSVKIELMSKNGGILLSANQQIASTDELKTLIINGKHRMVMNTNTTLAIKPLAENTNIGCLVSLASGQIYTHVEHNGTPFIVDTAHGKAVITGTTFDVKVTDDSTTLVVSEGTVQFESEKGTVKVTAGQTSKIVGQSAPSIPLSCNTAELTAWATGYKPGPALAQAESNTDPLYLPSSLRKVPIVLEETDYDHWVEKHRDWFKREFPWTFQLKDALAKEGIEVDYPELLIQSGDVWQFVCLEVSPARFSVINPESLLNTASDYGFDKQWLLGNISTAKYAMEKPVLLKNSFTGLKAFEQWLEYLDETNKLKPPIPIYSHHASKYLANTRSLIWFSVRDGQYDLTGGERVEVLALLQEEVTAACNCQNDELYPQDKLKPSYCEDKSQEPIDLVIGHIKTMKAVEERIAEYEISK